MDVVHESLDLISAVLLVTGQINIGGIFIQPDGFSLSLSGPITGGGAVVKDNERQAQPLLDGLDILTAVLLLLRQIQVVGTYITAGRFTIVVSGPPFGATWLRALPQTAVKRAFFTDYKRLIAQKTGIGRWEA